MSIAPPVGTLAQQPRAAGQLAEISRAARGRAEDRADDARPRPSISPRKAEEFTRGMVTGGTLFEELGFYYVGPVDGHDVNALGRGARECPRRRYRADAGPCRDAKGQGLWPGRGQRRQISWRGQVRRRLGQAGQGPGRRTAVLSERLRRNAGQAGRNRPRRSSRSPRRCRRAPGSTSSPRRIPSAPSTSASPSSMA